LKFQHRGVGRNRAMRASCYLRKAITEHRIRTPAYRLFVSLRLALHFDREIL